MELQPQPTKTYLIHRHRESTEYQFTTSDPGGPITHYYILAPPKYQSDQHYKKWRAIIHSGGDPKTHSPAESPITCRIARAIWWKKIYIETGGGIQREVKTDEKAFKVKSLNRSNKVRKAFCMRPKALEWSAEDESALQGFGEGLRERAREKLVMVHKGHRKYEFEVAGVKYQWTGTKLHSGGLVRGIRLNGFAYSVKVYYLIASRLGRSLVQKKYNMCGSLTGFLHFYTDEKTEILPEPVIVHTAFGMIRAEKHKRDTVFEILGEIAKNAGG